MRTQKLRVTFARRVYFLRWTMLAQAISWIQKGTRSLPEDTARQFGGQYACYLALLPTTSYRKSSEGLKQWR